MSPPIRLLRVLRWGFVDERMHLVITRLRFGDDFDVKWGPDFAC